MSQLPEQSDRSAEPSIWRPQPQLTHTVSGPDELERLNTSGGVAVVFDHLAKEPVHIAFDGSQSTTLSVWTTRSRSGFVSRPKIPSDVVTIRFVTRGSLSRSGFRGNDTLVTFDQALFTSFEEMRFAQASPQFAAITASISRTALVDACIAMGGRDSPTLPRFDQVIDLRSVPMVSLRTSLTLLHDQLPKQPGDADMMTPLLQDLLVFQIISAWPAADALLEQRAPTSADRSVRLAIDYIEANLRRKIGIAEIAAAAGLSVRGLQIAFKRQMECSPVQFLIARRLDKVNAGLHAGLLPTIGQVASEWGFTHMSDFARRYRERFGHTPRLSKPR